MKILNEVLEKDLENGIFNVDLPVNLKDKDTSFGDRSVYSNQEKFDQEFQFQPPKHFSYLEIWNYYFCCSSSYGNFFEFFLKFMPILEWLPVYSWKENLIGDLIAGITVGIVHVPQGIAYAILTGVEPVYGLYTSFFGVLFYMVFGTSKHVSIGSFAIVSLMTGISSREIRQTIDNEFFAAKFRYLDDANLNHQDINLGNLSLTIPRLQVEHWEIVQAITLSTGIIHIFMAILRIEFLASYLSDQLVNGFCTGAAVHVIVVQMSKLIQLKSGEFTGVGYLIKQIHHFFTNLWQTNNLALIISLAAFLFLYIGKDRVNPQVRKKLPAPIPFELLLVVFATLISWLLNLEAVHNITVVKTVPLGLPVAKLPRWELLPYVLGDSLEIAFVVVALHLSMCKVFNRKMGTRTNNNMELYALGFVGSLSSFFNTYPISSSIGRSMLNVECGAKTQLSAFFTGILLLIVILFLGPLLSSLPMCVLAVIIIYSIKGLFQKMPKELANLWRVSKIDFLIWSVTFFATLFLNVMQGLLLAVAFALLTTVFRIQWPHWHLLSRLSGTEYYRDSDRYLHTTNYESIRIFRFDAPLLFTNVEHFANSAKRAVFGSNLNLNIDLKNLKKTSHEKILFEKTPLDDSGIAVQVENKISQASDRILAATEILEQLEKNPVKHFIIDCSGFTFVDYSSVDALIDLFNQLCQNNIRVYFAGAKAPIRDMFEACGFFDAVGKENFYPTIHDCVLAAHNKRLSVVESSQPLVFSDESPTLIPVEDSLKNESVLIRQQSQKSTHATNKCNSPSLYSGSSFRNSTYIGAFHSKRYNDAQTSTTHLSMLSANVKRETRKRIIERHHDELDDI